MKRKYATWAKYLRSVKIGCQKSDQKKKGYISSQKYVTRLELLSGGTQYTIYSQLNPVTDYQNKFHFVNSEL